MVFFETLTKHPINWQQNPTLLPIVRKMLDKTPLHDKKILVLFNIEFLQALIEERNVNPENIYYIADNELENLCSLKIYKVKSYWLKHNGFNKENKPVYKVADLKELLQGLNMKFDLVFSNPPYNSNLDVKILNEIIDISNEFVVIHPSISVIDIKGKTSDFVNFKKKANFKSIELFMGNKLFDIQLENPCMISHIDNSYKGEITVIDLDKKQTYSVKDSNLITKYGKEWIDFVQAFYLQIKSHCENNSLWSNRMMDCTRFQDDSKFFVQLTAMMMGYSKGVDKPADKFYSLTMKNYSSGGDKNWNNGNVGVRDYTPKTDKTLEPKKPSYEFDTEEQRINFLNYCQTDFARFCLSLIKNNAHLDSGELGLVPWLDFNEAWDDAKLYEKFDVSQQMQDYIRDFLPDFHGIRK